MSSDQESIWLKEFSFFEKNIINFSVMDVEYCLENISDKTIKLVKKIKENITEKYIAFDAKTSILRIQPAFHELPLMIKLNQELLIGSRREVDCLLDIPIKIQLLAQTETDSMTLDEIKNENLMQSLYGPANAGIFCNAIYSQVYTDSHSIVQQDYCAAMPIIVASNYISPVSVSRVLVSMDKLMLFLMADKLISNKVVMNIKNSTEADITYSSETIAPGLARLLENRSPLTGGTMSKLIGLGTSKSSNLQYGF